MLMVGRRGDRQDPADRLDPVGLSVIRRWDVLVEVRELSIKEAHDSRLGALVGVYRHFGDHVKLGLGYNFTDYSDDLGDLSYDERGWFVNLIGKF
jgi:hypothetical protein